MKLLKVRARRYVFQLGRMEQKVLCSLLGRYPVIPPTHFPLSGTAHKELAENQQLLEEFMAAHREENRRLVARFLASKSRFKPASRGVHLSLKAEELEWLLQVLNDIRIGSWLALGSPDLNHPGQLALTEQTAPYLWAMEVTGQFQTALVHGRHHVEPPTSLKREDDDQ